MSLHIRVSLFYSLLFSIAALVMAWLWQYDLSSAIVSVIYGLGLPLDSCRALSTKNQMTSLGRLGGLLEVR